MSRGQRKAANDPVAVVVKMDASSLSICLNLCDAYGGGTGTGYGRSTRQLSLRVGTQTRYNVADAVRRASLDSAALLLDTTLATD